MAEFAEVCSQWRRMCKSFGDDAAKSYRPCMEKCPVGSSPVCGELCEATPEDIKKFEAAVMKWAAEHPEPVYPTWAEYLTSIGVYPKGWEMYQTPLKSEIPADIAQKLGLEPKE